MDRESGCARKKKRKPTFFFSRFLSFFRLGCLDLWPQGPFRSMPIESGRLCYLVGRWTLKEQTAPFFSPTFHLPSLPTLWKRENMSTRRLVHNSASGSHTTGTHWYCCLSLPLLTANPGPVSQNATIPHAPIAITPLDTCSACIAYQETELQRMVFSDRWGGLGIWSCSWC